MSMQYSLNKCNSNTVTPDELLGDCIFRHVTQFSQEWSLLEVDIHAVSKTYFILSNEALWLDSEWVADPTTTLLQAGERDLTCLLGESHWLECSLYLVLFRLDFFKRIGFSGLVIGQVPEVGLACFCVHVFNRFFYLI